MRLSHGAPDGNRHAHEPEHEVGDGDPEEPFEPSQEPDSSERERLAQVDDAQEVEHDLDRNDHRAEADEHGDVDGQPQARQLWIEGGVVQAGDVQHAARHDEACQEHHQQHTKALRLSSHGRTVAPELLNINNYLFLFTT